MESPRDEDQFDWTFPLPLQPVNPTNLEGAGTVCETKRFDSFYNANGDRVELPAGERYRATGAQAYHSALSVTTYWNRQQEFETTVLEVRSRHMKAALRAVVPAYSSYNITARHISISGEPWCLFHYRQELLDYGAQLVHQGYDVEAAHVQHLISYMWTTFANEILAFYTVEFATGFDPSLEHKYLWMVFRPGDILYIRERGSCAFLLKELSLRASWILSGYCIDYDGKSYGFRSFSAIISRYDGIRPLKKLEVVQLNWLSEEERQIIKEKLVTRGQRFVGIHGQQCLSYNEYSDESTGGRV
ncbi:aaa family ATPase [Grosmannia clavigera kw1407]|uniref:Aaa family ATPase n=1 Tax=Grosmannia clavigera (strain kw1407 / UAMH 11150) TaxID=655863 RepID=F0XKW2_GROCL|nr:aaa family ATPase [Grosmannia clavigera kw1407]EFX01671.1 aaa family ATPase [Grosmannia clavigera kw1407]